MLLNLTGHFLKFCQSIVSLKLFAQLQAVYLVYLVQLQAVCVPDYPVLIKFEDLPDLSKLV